MKNPMPKQPQDAPQKQQPPMQPTPPAAKPRGGGKEMGMTEHIRSVEKMKAGRDGTGAY